MTKSLKFDIFFIQHVKIRNKKISGAGRSLEERYFGTWKEVFPYTKNEYNRFYYHIRCRKFLYSTGQRILCAFGLYFQN